MKLSRGKYIAFVDADDMLLQNALEILINAAVENNADVVHSEGYLVPIGRNGNNFSIIPETYQAPPFVDKPALETDNLAERVQRFFNGGYIWHSWGKLFRRDFLIENRIEFVDAAAVEEMIFVFECICRAPRYVRIPAPFYVRTRRPDSFIKVLSEQLYNRNMLPLVNGVEVLARLIDTQKFFIDNPSYRTALLNFAFGLGLTGTRNSNRI